jgi:hypothetical protein
MISFPVSRILYPDKPAGMAIIYLARSITAGI